MSYWLTPIGVKGDGSPEGVVTADVSTLYQRTDGGQSTTLYVKESGTGNTGWVAYGPTSGQPIAGAKLHLPGVQFVCPSTANVASWTPGDLDMRAMVAPDDWTSGATQTLIGCNDAGSGQKCADLIITSLGKLGITYSADGVTSTTVNSTATIPGITDGTAMPVRATFDVNNGAGGGTMEFFTSSDGGVTWDSYETKAVVGTTTLHKSTKRISVGARDSKDLTCAGTFAFAEIRDGIGGALVAGVDFYNTPHWSGTDTAGNVWTLAGTGWYWTL